MGLLGERGYGYERQPQGSSRYVTRVPSPMTAGAEKLLPQSYVTNSTEIQLGILSSMATPPTPSPVVDTPGSPPKRQPVPSPSRFPSDADTCRSQPKPKPPEGFSFKPSASSQHPPEQNPSTPTPPSSPASSSPTCSFTRRCPRKPPAPSTSRETTPSREALVTKTNARPSYPSSSGT